MLSVGFVPISPPMFVLTVLPVTSIIQSSYRATTRARGTKSERQGAEKSIWTARLTLQVRGSVIASGLMEYRE